MSQLLLFHKDSPGPWSWQGHRTDWLFWGTCLRQIAIGLDSFTDRESTAGSEGAILVDAAAYGYLLEVICGLRSPIIGETEVSGQFKQFLDSLKLLADDSRADLVAALLPTFQRLQSDAKLIRHRYLRGLGGQSYGSLVRREARGLSEVHILGAGHLAREILPWLSKSVSRTVVHARTLRPEAKVPATVEVRTLSAAQAVSGLVVVAAPMSAQEVAEWLSARDGGVTKLIDLRGDGHEDPIPFVGDRVHLLEVMAEIAARQNGGQEAVAKARQAIAAMAEAYGASARIRPQGWDDICAS